MHQLHLAEHVAQLVFGIREQHSMLSLPLVHAVLAQWRSMLECSPSLPCGLLFALFGHGLCALPCGHILCGRESAFLLPPKPPALSAALHLHSQLHCNGGHAQYGRLPAEHNNQPVSMPAQCRLLWLRGHCADMPLRHLLPSRLHRAHSMSEWYHCTHGQLQRHYELHHLHGVALQAWLFRAQWF